MNSEKETSNIGQDQIELEDSNFKGISLFHPVSFSFSLRQLTKKVHLVELEGLIRG